MMKNMLITGATGFIGGFIVEEALKRNLNVWVAVRKSSSRKYLTDPRIHFLELNLNSKADLKAKLQPIEFHYVVHAAGVTKSLNQEDFFRVNTDGTRNLVDILRELQMPLSRFVFVSSLSVMGPVREKQPYTEIVDSDTPQPNTAYGRSKLAAENYLDSLSNFPYIVLRPTGVYGPREKDYFMMAKSIKNHVDFAAGFRKQDLTFIYVLDVVQAIFLALDRGVVGKKYFLSDGQVYASSQFSNLIHEELGRPWWIRIIAPLWLLRLITWVGERIGHLTGRISALNNDKYNIMKQRNWRCNIAPAENELGYSPRYQLAEGVRLTIRWYKENGWL